MMNRKEEIVQKRKDFNKLRDRLSKLKAKKVKEIRKDLCRTENKKIFPHKNKNKKTKKQKKMKKTFLSLRSIMIMIILNIEE